MPDPEELKQLLQLLAPGFVILGIRQWFIVGPPPPLSERALSYAAISAAYLAVVVPLVNLAGDKLYFFQLTRDVLAYFAIPVFIGLGYSWVAEKGWLNRFWQFVRIAPVHRIPATNRCQLHHRDAE